MKARMLAAALALIGVTLPLSAADLPAQIVLHEEPQPIAEITFAYGEGNEAGLSDWRGKVVLLNVWATWCVPRRREIPSLDRLGAQLGGTAFEVVALSIDRGGAEVVCEFYDAVGVRRLALTIDASGKAAPALGIVGLPTTILIDRDRRELGRLVGPAEWDTPEMVSFPRGHVLGRTDSENSGSVGGRPTKIARAPIRRDQALTFQSLEGPYARDQGKESHS